MRCAFPNAAVIAGEADFLWMTATISEPDQFDNYHFLKMTAYAFFQLIWKIKIITKRKTMNPETKSEQWQAEES